MGQTFREVLLREMSAVQGQLEDAFRRVEEISGVYEAMERLLRQLPNLDSEDPPNRVGNDGGDSHVARGTEIAGPKEAGRFRMRQDVKPRMNLRDEPIDFSDDVNLEQRVVRIARATRDGIVTCIDARDILADHGVSKANRINLRNLTQKALYEHEDFCHIGPGTFRYMPFSDENRM